MMQTSPALSAAESVASPKRKLPWILLSISVAINIFAVAMFVTMMARKAEMGGGFGRQQMMQVMAALPDEKQKEIRHKFRKQFVTNMRNNPSMVRNDYHAIADMVAKKDVTKQELEQVLSTLQQHFSERISSFQPIIVETVLSLTPQEREKVAQAMRSSAADGEKKRERFRKFLERRNAE